MKPTIFLQEKERYLAIKVDCGRRLNAGALEKHSNGTPSGILSARKWLLELIAKNGGDLTQRKGYTHSMETELHGGGGAGYAGWVDFGDHEKALHYLRQHFVIKRCRCHVMDPLEAFSEERTI